MHDNVEQGFHFVHTSYFPDQIALVGAMLQGVSFAIYTCILIGFGFCVSGSPRDWFMRGV